MSEQRKVTLLGTGLMGAPMARNLLAAGFPVTVWNRSAEKARPLADQGATVADTPAHAVAQADVIVTMLADGYATGALLEDPSFYDQLKPGAVWIDMSSAKPEHARAQSAQLETLGLRHLDAPVSGGTKGAEAGSLAIMVGGDEKVMQEVLPVLSAMGRPVHVGPSGAGQLCKLANQTIVAVTISAVAEATLLAEQGGADPAALRAALRGGFADSVILQQHGERMSNRDFVPGGLSKFQLKDLDNTLDEARGLGLELPNTQAVRDRFEYLINEMDGAELDHSALYLELRKRNGMS
ncbi:NAD(P)-dependent oxidoreductase [Ruegeria arenilitoris]|uniref:NAD(P)-dependent oxidoreductase n=1 Tax=Ruegeria arenilitoris TaxID=1173585 RepID=UPI00147E26FB|nr:NAD(P)-dependent oxidoreductase [Ruegeria arenilitoris]MBY6084018.1 NAD(P)-dependent oxidoreductase [Ruegeria arenilitoris]